MAVGNGQHLACASLVLAAALGTIKLLPGDTSSGVPKFCPAQLKVLPVAADGRCFFTSLFLALACSSKQRFEWSQIVRNDSGFPIDNARMEFEDRGAC